MTLDRTLQTALEGFLDHGLGQGGTRETYRAALARFLGAAKIETLAEALAFDRAEQTVHVLEKSYRSATVALSVSAAKRFYRHLRLSGETDNNPMLDVSVKQRNNVPDWNVLREGDLAKLLESIDSPRDRAVVIALGLQGWRVSDLTGMTWRNLNETPNGWIAEWTAKGNKPRRQKLQTAVMDAIRTLDEPGKKGKRSGPLIPKQGAEPLTRHLVWEIVTRHTEAYGRRVTPHGLRATYISSAIARKGIEAARQLAAHASINTTQRYSRWVVVEDAALTPEDL